VEKQTEQKTSNEKEKRISARQCVEYGTVPTSNGVHKKELDILSSICQHLLTTKAHA